jgi:coiled-coil domain-containing protein 130
VSGARRQENRWDPTQNGQIVPETKETQRKLFDDAMFKLEHGVKDQKSAEDDKPVMSRLFKRNDDLWKDNFEVNMKLRAAFRKTKKDMKAKEDADNKVLLRTSLAGSVKLLPESEEDRQLAGLMKLHSTKNIEEQTREKLKKIMENPMLPSSSSKSSTVTSINMKKKRVESGKSIGDLGIVRKSLVGVKRKAEETKTTSLVSSYSSSDE